MLTQHSETQGLEEQAIISTSLCNKHSFGPWKQSSVEGAAMFEGGGGDVDRILRSVIHADIVRGCFTLFAKFIAARNSRWLTCVLASRETS